MYNYGTSNPWWIVPVRLLCCVLETEPAPCLANHFDCLSLSWTDSDSGYFLNQTVESPETVERIKVFLIAFQYQSNVVSTLINWLEVPVPLVKLHTSFSLGSFSSLHLLSSQWVSHAFSRTLGSVRFLCNAIYNVLALPTAANFAVPQCEIQLVSPDTALEPLLSSSGRYNGQALCLVLLWGTRGTSLLGSAILRGPEELQSPVETNKFLLAPAESRC